MVEVQSDKLIISSISHPWSAIQAPLIPESLHTYLLSWTTTFPVFQPTFNKNNRLFTQPVMAWNLLVPPRGINERGATMTIPLRLVTEEFMQFCLIVEDPQHPPGHLVTVQSEGDTLSGVCNCGEWKKDELCLHVLGVLLNKAQLLRDGDVKKMQVISALAKGKPSEHRFQALWEKKLRS